MTSADASARCAPSLAVRNLRFLLALAPGALLLALAQPALFLRLALAAMFALALESLCLRLRRLPVAPFLAEGSALRIALLFVLWLPVSSWQALYAGLALAIVLARHALGGLGRSPFNGAMVAVACAQLLFATAPPALDAGGHWVALAWLAGGLVLLALRQVRWQAPLALLCGAALVAWPRGEGLVLFTSGPWLLAAFFIWPEPGTHGESAAVRLVAAALAGALAVLAGGGAGLRALPFAIVLVNALLPALEARVAPRRRAPA